MRRQKPAPKFITRITPLILIAVIVTAIAPPAFAVFQVTAPTLFTSLDGSVNDNDGLVNGIFTRFDDLEFLSGGSVTHNDIGASGNSAQPMFFDVFGDVTMFAGSSLFAENQNNGGSGAEINLSVGGNLTLQGTQGPTLGAIVSSSKTGGTGGTGVAGPINFSVLGDIHVQAGAQVLANSTGSAGAINMTGKFIDIDGLVASRSSLTGTGANQAPGGGTITIAAMCDLTVGDTGVISSRGEDPGADLVHLEGCEVVIYGLVESTGEGHAVPDSPANSLNGANRPDKSPNSTAGVEIWAAHKLVIDNTGTHNGEVNADLTIGAAGRSWIDLISGEDIELISDGTGSFLVHGTNAGNNPTGATIQLIAVGGDIVSSGLAVDASAGGSGFPDGGLISIRAFNDVLLGNSQLIATGDFAASGGFGNGGQILVRTYNGDLVWIAGIGDVRPTGVNAGIGVPGTVDLIYAATLPTLTGTTFPSNFAGGPPTITQNLSGGAPLLQEYVQLPEECDNCLIPEPSTAALAFLGLLGLIRFSRRQRGG